MKTKFRYLEDVFKEKMKDPEFRRLYEEAKKIGDLAYGITELRHKMGISQSEFARRTGLTQQIISRIEHNTYTLETTERYAKTIHSKLGTSA